MKSFRIIAAVATITLAAIQPATAATPSPLASLQYLVGTWNCTYNAGTAHMPYVNTYAYDRNGHILRQVAHFAGDVGDEELIAYDAKHAQWTAVVIDDTGTTTIMHATGADAHHIAYRSTYPDTTLAVAFDPVIFRGHEPITQYTLHATYVAAGKTIHSFDTCSRATR